MLHIIGSVLAIAASVVADGHLPSFCAGASGLGSGSGSVDDMSAFAACADTFIVNDKPISDKIDLTGLTTPLSVKFDLPEFDAEICASSSATVAGPLSLPAKSFELEPLTDGIFTTADTRAEPLVSFACDADALYTVVMNDYVFPFFHGMYVNVPCVDGMAQASAGKAAWPVALGSGSGFLPPGTPYPAPGLYTYMVFKQDAPAPADFMLEAKLDYCLCDTLVAAGILETRDDAIKPLAFSAFQAVGSAFSAVVLAGAEDFAPLLDFACTEYTDFATIPAPSTTAPVAVTETPAGSGNQAMGPAAMGEPAASGEPSGSGEGAETTSAPETSAPETSAPETSAEVIEKFKDAIAAIDKAKLKAQTVTAGAATKAVFDAIVAAAGSQLPGLTEEDVAKFDTDGDGKFSAAEIAAVAKAFGVDSAVEASDGTDSGANGGHGNALITVGLAAAAVVATAY